MMMLKNEQLGAMQLAAENTYLESLLRHFRSLGLPFLPEADADARRYLSAKLLEARRFRFSKPAHCERYLYLCLSYPQLNGRVYTPEIVDNLSWPDRSEADKLAVLFRTLTRSLN